MALAFNRPIPRRELDEAPLDERPLHQMLDTMFDEGRAFRERLESEWDMNLSYLRGEQWLKPRPAGFTQITDNQLWRIEQQAEALLTDTRPNITITSKPDNSAWFQINQELRTAVEAVWFQQDIDRLLGRAIRDLYITSKAFFKIFWDHHDEAFGLGDIAVHRINPRYMYQDPAAPSLKQAEWICYRTPISLWDIQRKFDPERALRVRPDASLSQFTESRAKYRIPLSWMPMPRRREPVRESAIPKAWVEEWWFRDPAKGPDGLPKYPTGRMVTRTKNVVLFDSPNPYWDPWPGPWVDFTINQLEDHPYGEPEITQLRGMQDGVNVVLGLIIDNARFITNGVWIMDEDALSQTERRKLASRPGAIVAKRPGRELRRDTGQSLPGQVLEVLNALKMDLQFVSGLMDTGYGRPPRGVTAASAIDQLQMATQATIRLKGRELEGGLVRVGARIVSRVFQYYTQQRIMDIEGSEGIVAVTWDPGMLKPLRYGPDSEAFPALTEEDRRELLKQFRVRVTPGSSLAISKEKRWAMDMALYSAGLIDKKAVLDNMDYPNRDEIMRRMAQAEAQAMLARGAQTPGAATQAAAGPKPRGRGVNITQKIIGR